MSYYCNLASPFHIDKCYRLMISIIRFLQMVKKLLEEYEQHKENAIQTTSIFILKRKMLKVLVDWINQNKRSLFHENIKNLV